MSFSERELEQKLIEKLLTLKYEYRPDIIDRALLEEIFGKNFRR